MMQPLLPWHTYHSLTHSPFLVSILLRADPALVWLIWYSGPICAAHIYILYAPNWPAPITAFVWEREHGRFNRAREGELQVSTPKDTVRGAVCFAQDCRARTAPRQFIHSRRQGRDTSKHSLPTTLFLPAYCNYCNTRSPEMNSLGAQIGIQ